MVDGMSNRKKNNHAWKKNTKNSIKTYGSKKHQRTPGVLIVIDSNFETIAVEEAKKLGIPIVGIVDTNANPDGISYPVPGNDDAIRSIKLFTSKFGEAVKVGLEKRISDSLNQEKQFEAQSKSESETVPVTTTETPKSTGDLQQTPGKTKKGNGSENA